MGEGLEVHGRLHDPLLAQQALCHPKLVEGLPADVLVVHHLTQRRLSQSPQHQDVVDRIERTHLCLQRKLLLKGKAQSDGGHWRHANGDSILNPIPNVMSTEQPPCEWFTTLQVARSLNISVTCIRRWIGCKRLQSEVIDHVHRVSRAELRNLARREPELFGGITEAELLQLLGNEDAARWVAGQNLPARSMRRPVVCLDTGQRFVSIGAAADAAGVCRQTMRRAVIEGYRAKGKRYRLLRPDIISTNAKR